MISSYSIVGTLKEFMAMPAMLYYVLLLVLGFESLPLALGVTSSSGVVVARFYIHNLITSLFAVKNKQIKQCVMVEQGRTEEGGGGGGMLAMASSSTVNNSPTPNREAASNSIPYPPPLAKYEDVVISPKLFMDTLDKLRVATGTKFTSGTYTIVLDPL